MCPETSRVAEVRSRKGDPLIQRQNRIFHAIPRSTRNCCNFINMNIKCLYCKKFVCLWSSLRLLELAQQAMVPFSSSLSDVKYVLSLCLHCIKSLVSLHSSLRLNIDLEVDLNGHRLPPSPLSPQRHLLLLVHIPGVIGARVSNIGYFDGSFYCHS